MADAKSLQPNTGTLSVFTNEKGGINDDLILSSAENFLYVVTNAGTRDKDMAAMSKKLQEMKAKGKDVTLRFADDRALLAVQGEFFAEGFKIRKGNNPNISRSQNGGLPSAPDQDRPEQDALYEQPGGDRGGNSRLQGYKAST